jgi:hypothetical protein
MFAQHGHEGMDASAGKVYASGAGGVESGGQDDLFFLRGIPQCLEAGHGGRNTAGTGGRADQCVKIGPDVNFGVMHQPDDGAVGMRAIGGIAEM